MTNQRQDAVGLASVGATYTCSGTTTRVSWIREIGFHRIRCLVIMAAEFSTLHEHEYYSTVVICLLGTETQVDGSACPQQQAPPYRFQSLHSTAAAGGKKVEHASEGARDNTAG
jgi:hypothetical protein